MSTNPHDALFKAVFADTDHARAALQSICPRPVADEIRWPTLVQCPGSFIDGRSS